MFYCERKKLEILLICVIWSIMDDWIMIAYSFDKNTIVFSIQFLILIYKIEIKYDHHTIR